MKNIIYTLIFGGFIFTFTSCSHYYRFTNIGDLTMVATRNIDNSENYKQLKTYAGISRDDVEAARSASRKGKIKKNNPIIGELNSYKASNLQEAIDKVVKSVPGGEYLMNLKIYAVGEYSGFRMKNYNASYVATGDVWGGEKENADIKGFQVNDNVLFTYTKDLRKVIGKKNFKGSLDKQYKGRIMVLKGSRATIQVDNSTVVDIPYSYLINIKDSQVSDRWQKGDRVQWKSMIFKNNTGIIVEIVGDEAVVKNDKDGQNSKVKVSQLIRLE